jgi:hypothetical protein
MAEAPEEYQIVVFKARMTDKPLLTPSLNMLNLIL